MVVPPALFTATAAFEYCPPFKVVEVQLDVVHERVVVLPEFREEGEAEKVLMTQLAKFKVKVIVCPLEQVWVGVGVVLVCPEFGGSIVH